MKTLDMQVTGTRSGMVDMTSEEGLIVAVSTTWKPRPGVTARVELDSDDFPLRVWDGDRLVFGAENPLLELADLVVDVTE